jgi:hypothetical protein
MRQAKRHVSAPRLVSAFFHPAAILAHEHANSRALRDRLAVVAAIREDGPRPQQKYEDADGGDCPHAPHLLSYRALTIYLE